jgi:hypothetical protein
MSGSKVTFQENYKGINMWIELLNPSPLKALEGLDLLEVCVSLSNIQDEMPAEISFFVPESYHKRIIGVGGKNIQRIMKKYGVYVKFSNAEEYAALGGYYQNEHNVIARTPAKNEENLEALHGSILELLTGREKREEIGMVEVLHQYHRSVDTGRNVTGIEAATSTDISFEEGDQVRIVGRGDKIKEAGRLIKEFVPYRIEVNMPGSKVARDVIKSVGFEDLRKKIEKEYGARVNVYDGNVMSIIMNYHKEKHGGVIKRLVVSYLEGEKVQMDFTHESPKSSPPRIFPVSGMFTPPPIAAPGPHSTQTLISPPILNVSNYSLFDPRIASGLGVSNGSSHSAPNLRALFSDEGEGKLTHSALSESYDNVFGRLEEGEGVGVDLLGDVLGAVDFSGRGIWAWEDGGE